MEPFELAIQAAKVASEEWGRLEDFSPGLFAPEELEQLGLDIGWLVAEEFQKTVSGEMAELVLEEVRSGCRKQVERLLAEEA